MPFAKNIYLATLVRTAIIAGAFLLVDWLRQLITWSFASFLGIAKEINWFSLSQSAHADVWAQCLCRTEFYIVAPMLLFFMGVLLHTILPNRGSTLFLLRYGLFWMGIWMIMQLPAGWIAGIFTQSGLWYVMEGLNLPIYVSFGLGVLLLGIVVLFGHLKIIDFYIALGLQVKHPNTTTIQLSFIRRLLVPIGIAIGILIVWYHSEAILALHSFYIVVGALLLFLPIFYANKVIMINA